MSVWAMVPAPIAVGRRPPLSPVPKAVARATRRIHLDLRVNELFSHDSLRRYREQHGGDAIVSYRVSPKLLLVDALGVRATRTQTPTSAALAALGLAYSAGFFYQIGEREQVSATIGQDVSGTPLSDRGANFMRYVRLDLTVRLF